MKHTKRKYPSNYIKASTSLSKEDVRRIIKASKPKKNNYIGYSFDFDDEELTLAAYPTNDEIYYDDELDDMALDNIVDWATAIASKLANDPQWNYLAEEIENQLSWDWYSGMSFEADGPFTYNKFEFTVGV